MIILILDTHDNLDLDTHKDGWDFRVLHHAVYNNMLQVVAKLISKGASVNCLAQLYYGSYSNKTPMEIAHIYGHIECMKILAQVPGKYITDYTGALYYAISEGEYDLACLLVKAGAKIKDLDELVLNDRKENKKVFGLENRTGRLFTVLDKLIYHPHDELLGVILSTKQKMSSNLFEYALEHNGMPILVKLLKAGLELDEYATKYEASLNRWENVKKIIDNIHPSFKKERFLNELLNIALDQKKSDMIDFLLKQGASKDLDNFETNISKIENHLTLAAKSMDWPCIRAFLDNLDKEIYQSSTFKKLMMSICKSAIDHYTNAKAKTKATTEKKFLELVVNMIPHYSIEHKMEHLMCAVERKHLNVVNALIKNGVPINRLVERTINHQKMKITPLYAAILTRSVSITTAILNAYGIRADLSPEEDIDALMMLAIIPGELEIVKLLLYYTVNLSFEHLEKAADLGHWDCVQELASCKNEIQPTREQFMHLSYLAVSQQNPLTMLCFLIILYQKSNLFQPITASSDRRHSFFNQPDENRKYKEKEEPSFRRPMH